MAAVRTQRQLDVVAWLFIGVGVASLAGPAFGVAGREVGIAIFELAVGFNLLILAIPIGFGLRTRRDGCRNAALGTAFLCMCVSVMSILLLMGNGGYALPGGQQGLWGALAVWGAASAVSGWVAWVLTRAPALRVFGNA